MQTVDKAFDLLGLFSEAAPELGLSELARRAGFDKATTRRLLVALSRHGFIEQSAETRGYRIGPGVLRLAQLREATFPLTDLAEQVLESLAEETGETAHFALHAGDTLSTVAMRESDKANRVTMSVGEPLPLHATASGITVLAYSSDNALQRFVKFEKYTEKTPTSKAQLSPHLERARKDGYVENRGFFEADVCSVAAPVFDGDSVPLGAIAVAAPSTRFNSQQRKFLRGRVLQAAARLTRLVGGRHPSAKAA